MQDIIRTAGLTKAYKGVPVVSDVDLNVKKGEIYGFIGRNGAGKTTTIRMILNLTKPTSGHVELFGETTTDKNMYNNLRKIGAIIESPGFYMNLSARENLDIQRLMMDASDKASIDRVLATVGLSEEANKRVSKYSLGMRQRLGIARALLHKPELLLLDEPTNGLDPQGVVEIRELLLSIAAEGTTILVSSHILSEVEKIVTRIGILNKGKLLEELSKDNFQTKCKQTTVYKVNSVEKAATLIKQYLSIDDLSILGDTISFSSIEQVGNAKLNKILIDNDIEIIESKIIRSSLEDYFLEITGA
ncbi:MAG: ATP-binding cassette domain-containing protein [Herbinix sp.]|nr:ATP-binding cassette domain-containing protein [Herbinix sp.]